MLVSRLLRSLLRFLSPGIVPEGEGGAAPAPAPDPAAAPAPTPDPAAAPAPAAPTDAFAGVRDAIASMGEDPAASPLTQPRDDLGRFAPKDPTAAPTAAPAPAPAAQAPATPPAPTPAPTPAPKPGEVDLTPPEGLSERAKERFTQLAERAKLVPELEQRVTQAETSLASVRQLVNESGLAPQEFTEMLDMARLYKSANPQDAQRALQMLDGLRSDLATRFGLDAPGVDPLTAHPDLQQKVQGMLMTREDALEQGRLREQVRRAEGTSQQHQEQQQFVNTVNSAAAEMDKTLNALAGTPGHEAKVAYIANHFKDQANLKAFVTTYQPQQWKSVLLTMYHAYTPLPAVAAPAPAAAPTPPAPQPLRPGAMRAGAPQQNGPVTAESSVRAAFAGVFGG